MWLLLLAVTGLALAVLLAVTARRPVEQVPDLDGYLARWSQLHGGFDPTTARVTGGWLRLVYACARWPARLGVQPDALTLVGAWASAAILIPAYAGGRWPLLGTAVVVVSGLLDNLDGGVAALTGRASAFGYVLDSLVDRVSDALYLLALHALGAPGGVTVGAGAAVVLLEYTRARAAGAGRGEIGLVTPGERPTRIVITAFGLFTAGLFPAHAGVAGTGAALATLVICGVSFLLLLRDVHRALRSVSR